MKPSPLLLSILAALGGCAVSDAEVCVDADTDASVACPTRDEVDKDAMYRPGECGEFTVLKLLSEPTRKTQDGEIGQWDACCYDARISEPAGVDCIIGRPYVDGTATTCAPALGHTSDARAAAWLAAARAEHASVAAFARLTLELMAHGAPLELLAEVQAAALDEVRHTERCLTLARRFGATDVGLGAFPFAHDVKPARPLADIVRDAVRDGCLAETLGAHVADVACSLLHDPDVALTLAEVAEDEARHAALSWRLAAWAAQVGGDDVRAAIRDVLLGVPPTLDTHELAVRTGLPEVVLARAAREGVDTVLRPAAAVLWARAA